MTSQTFQYLYDANGNVGQLIDSSTGTLAAHYEYDPFGNLLVTSGPGADNNPICFSTKYLDAEIGWYYYVFRYYDPMSGRWFSRDLIGERGGVNLYGFVRNDPVNRIDFLGKFSEFIDCCPCQEKALEKDEELALQQMSDLIDEISQAIAQRPQERISDTESSDNGEFKDTIANDLEDAVKVLELAQKKLPKCKVKCVKEDTGRYAMVFPFGRTIKVYGDLSITSYWNLSDTVQAAALVHEATHAAAATTDATYFWQTGQGIKNRFFARYPRIASTYDTWILTGFCIPGLNCPTIVSVNELRQGGKECP